MTDLGDVIVEAGDYVFGVLGEPSETATIGAAWMRMLTLQLGILLEPYLDPAKDQPDRRLEQGGNQMVFKMPRFTKSTDEALNRLGRPAPQE